MHVDTVEPVLLGERAGATADDFEIDPEMPILWVGVGEARCRTGAVGNGDAPRCSLHQCA